MEMNEVPGFNWRNYWTGILWLPKVKGKMNLFAGRGYQVKTDWGVFDCCDKRSITQLFPYYEPEFKEFMLWNARKGELFVDVGANIGAHSVYAGRKFMEVLAIEPTVKVYECLKTNLRRMVPHSSAIWSAAWSSRGFLDLHSTVDTESNTLYDHDVSGNPARMLYSVPTVTLDSLLVRQGNTPSIIKIDVEGAEAEVLKGGEISIAQYRPKVFLESFAEGKIEECLSFFAKHDYSVAKVSGWNYVALPK